MSGEEQVTLAFAARLREIREAKGLSQDGLALRASLHHSAISQFERALKAPRIHTLIKLAGGLGVPAGDLLAGITWEPASPSAGSYRVASHDEGTVS